MICSNNEENKRASKNTIVKRLLQNGYKREFIEKNNNFSRAPRRSIDYVTFLKLPFQGESTVKRIRHLLRTSELSSTIRLIFQTQPSLARQLAPKKETISCPINCVTCKLSENSGLCKQKGVIYFISCKICNYQYVGEAKRCAGTRVKDHTHKENSLVYQHMRQFHPLYPLKWTWKILCKVKNWHTRTAAESIIAQRNGLQSQRVRELNYAILHNTN